VLQRFSYGELTNHELIEKELLFVPLDDGFDVETRLHDHFSAKKSFGMFSSIPDMPLYRDGQSELYYEDILGLDENFSRIKHLFTWLRVTYHAGKKEYKSGLIALVVMAVMTVLCLAILMLIFPFGWLADWLGSEEKGESHAKQNKRQLKARSDEICQIIEELKLRNSIQKK
jgi:hypothetical protein